jgi:hypothetical protein
MQAALYASYAATPWFRVEGTYNFGPEKFDGQQAWAASVLVQPSLAYPQIRAGHFQPSIGVRYDDHTMLVRQTASVVGANTLIAPNYAEYGAEATYYKPRWLSLTAGVFSARSLAENTLIDTAGQQVSLIEDEGRPSVLGRVALWPGLVQGKLTSYVGASVLVNGDFSLTSLFAGVGVQDRLSALGEYAISDREGLRETRNLTVDLSYQAVDPLVLTVRGERGETRLHRGGGSTTRVVTRQAVLGAQVFLLPQVELRPEFRLMDTETFRSTRYALQLHLFY